MLRLITLFIALILVACERDGALTQPPPLLVSDANGFARFIDEQQSLAAGEYTILATSTAAQAGLTGSYTLTVTYPDGRQDIFTGSWASSPGQTTNLASYDAANVHNFSLAQAGGVRIEMQSDLDAFFYLLDRAQSVEVVSTGTDLPWVTMSGSGVTTVAIDLAPNISDSDYYAEAYYDAIDVNDTRTLLSGFRQANCFTEDPTTNYGADVHLRFRDVRDLGYGRNMFWKFGCDGNGNEDAEPGAIAVFVENFNVRVLPGFPYSSLNLEAVVADDRQHHFGTNAIEFNTWANGNSGISSDNPTGRQFAKFYTFAPVSDDPYADEARLDKVNLDARGAKAMPLPCIYCHGGRGLALDETGQIDPHPQTAIRGDTDAKLQILNVDDLEFAEDGPYSRAAQEAMLRQINIAMYCTFPTTSVPAICNNLLGTSFAPQPAISGEWDARFMRELVQGWYGGDASVDTFPSTTFDSSFTPEGWDPASASNAAYPNVNMERLYHEVIKPSCLVCHARRGSTAQSDINLSSYTKFIGHLDQLEDYVYDRGIMPLSRLGYDLFWASEQPTILAEYLPGFTSFDSDSNIPLPGEPVAVTGPDRFVNVPVTLNAAASQFYESVQWEIIDSVSGSAPSLSDATSLRPVFDTDLDGSYTLQLTAMQGSVTHTDTIELTVTGSYPDPASLRFTTDIVPLFSKVMSTSSACTDCHTDTSPGSPGIQGGSTTGAPVVYNDPDPEALYADVMSRVNLNAPHDSPLLRKPLGRHHGGAQVINILNASDSRDYHTILTWITEGAVEN